LAHQPIFYPVLSEEYATQIARDWNSKDETSGFVGYVLRFSVQTEFLTHYEIHIVGSSDHGEYWIPAGELQQLNENIVAPSRSFQSSTASPGEKVKPLNLFYAVQPIGLLHLD
jgi:hypothetical protein